VPGYGLIFAEIQQQLKLLGEELVVIGKGVTEQRKRLGKRAPADHQLGTPARHQIERHEVLEHPYWIGRAEHDNGTGQLDRFRASGDGCKNDLWSRSRHVRTVMFAYSIDLQTEVVGELGLGNHLPQSLTWRHVWIGDLSESGQSEFHGCAIP
jgi:hypothetical protein